MEKGFEAGEVGRGRGGGEAGLFAGDDAEAAFEQRVFERVDGFDGEAGGLDDETQRGGKKHDRVSQMDHAEAAPLAAEIGDFEQERAAVGELRSEGAERFDGADAVFEHVEGGGVGIGFGGGGKVVEGVGDDASAETAAEFLAVGGGFDAGGFDVGQGVESAEEGAIAAAEFEHAGAGGEQGAVGREAG